VISPERGNSAFVVFQLDELRERLKDRGVTLVDDGDLPGARRFYAEDPWENRLEFIEPLAQDYILFYVTRK
jgi:hypothetical protein